MNAITEFQLLLRCKEHTPEWIKKCIHSIPPIGSGAFSMVFALNDDYVVKIVSEKTTIAFAKWIQSEQIKGFAQVRDVFEDILYLEGDEKNSLSIIVQERCTLDTLGITSFIHKLNAMSGGRWHSERSATKQLEQHQKFLQALLLDKTTSSKMKTLQSAALWIKNMQQFDPNAMLDVQSEENWARNRLGEYVLIDPVA